MKMSYVFIFVHVNTKKNEIEGERGKPSSNALFFLFLGWLCLRCMKAKKTHLCSCDKGEKGREERQIEDVMGDHTPHHHITSDSSTHTLLIGIVNCMPRITTTTSYHIIPALVLLCCFSPVFFSFVCLSVSLVVCAFVCLSGCLVRVSVYCHTCQYPCLCVMMTMRRFPLSVLSRVQPAQNVRVGG